MFDFWLCRHIIIYYWIVPFNLKLERIFIYMMIHSQLKMVFNRLLHYMDEAIFERTNNNGLNGSLITWLCLCLWTTTEIDGVTVWCWWSYLFASIFFCFVMMTNLSPTIDDDDEQRIQIGHGHLGVGGDTLCWFELNNNKNVHLRAIVRVCVQAMMWMVLVDNYDQGSWWWTATLYGFDPRFHSLMASDNLNIFLIIQLSVIIRLQFRFGAIKSDKCETSQYGASSSCSLIFFSRQPLNCCRLLDYWRLSISNMYKYIYIICMYSQYHKCHS